MPGRSYPSILSILTLMEARWNVICFSSVDWDFSPQRPHWVATTLASRGANVVFVDNLGFRLPRPRDAGRVIRRASSWLRTSLRPAREVRPGILRDSPIVAPLQHVGALRSLGRKTLVRRIGRLVGDRRPLIVWTYLPFPAIADAAQELDADLVVFDWVDDFSEHVLTRSPAHRRRLARWEHEMAERADMVFVASAELLRRRPSPNSRTFLIPHGVPQMSAGPPPPEIAALPHPRVGVFGTIDPWTDLDLLAGLAGERPDWTFVLVGPVVGVHTNGLRKLHNVVHLGPRPHDQMGAYLNELDVAALVYRVAPATTAASPLRLREYLAYGLPIVSVDLPEVRAFEPRVRIASGKEAFLAAIEEALREDRYPPLAEPTWEERVTEMTTQVERALLAKR